MKKAASKPKKKKPILLVKIGDTRKGWLPDKEHFESFTKMAKESGLSNIFNIIIYDYEMELKILDRKNNLEDYGLQIVDERKFAKMAIKEMTKKKLS